MFPVNSQSSIDIRSVMITALKHETKKYHLSGGGRAGRCSNGRSFCDCVEIKHSQADPWNGLYGGEKNVKRSQLNAFYDKRGSREMKGLARGAGEISAVRWSANKMSLWGDSSDQWMAAWMDWKDNQWNKWTKNIWIENLSIYTPMLNNGLITDYFCKDDL